MRTHSPHVGGEMQEQVASKAPTELDPHAILRGEDPDLALPLELLEHPVKHGRLHEIERSPSDLVAEEVSRGGRGGSDAPLSELIESAYRPT